MKVYWQYRKRYHNAELDHRAEFNLDRHPCLHQAFLPTGDKLEGMKMATSIPELELLPIRIIEQNRDAPEPPRSREINGILLGEEEEDGL